MHLQRADPMLHAIEFLWPSLEAHCESCSIEFGLLMPQPVKELEHVPTPHGYQAIIVCS